MFRPVCFAALLVILTYQAAIAHEYWIAPERFEVEAGAPVVARIKNGQKFEGIALPFLPAGYARFELVEGATMRPVTGRLGDDPALNMPTEAEGLAVVVLETAPSILNYTDAELFRNFVTHKDFAGALAEHDRRGLPASGFRETYTRYVKALVAVGHGRGEDRPAGLRTEIVAQANPYTDDLSAGLPLVVLFEGRPRADAQLELFARAPDGTVEITLHRTDDQGRVQVPVLPGHAYFADAVMLLDTGNDNAASGPVWESLWAGLSFAVPGR